jgi:hypothetical protein
MKGYGGIEGIWQDGRDTVGLNGYGGIEGI